MPTGVSRPGALVRFVCDSGPAGGADEDRPLVRGLARPPVGIASVQLSSGPTAAA
jgi:hypothetical protein